MKLAHRDVIPFLLRCGLISAHAVLDGEVAIVDATRRNRNFKVILENGTSYLLKQGLSEEGISTVAHEAGVYHMLQAASRDGHNITPGVSRAPRARTQRTLRPLREYMPHCYRYNAEEQVLVLELLREAETFREYHLRRGRFPTSLAVALGDALGALHSYREGESADEWLSGPLQQPWVLSLHRPRLNALHEFSAANLELVQLLQGAEELCHRLDAMRDSWRATSLMHFDLKWDNCIVKPATPSSSQRIQVVDWELAGRGDSDWDVGSVFAAYLSFWLLSIPLTGEDPPDRFLELARYPLDTMQPAIRSFWHAYIRRMDLPMTEAEERLLRATKYGAAQLIHAGFEQLQTSLQMAANVVCMAQLCLNILRRPHEAVVHLLGIPLENAGIQ